MRLHDAIVVLATEIQQYDEDKKKALEAGAEVPANPVAEATRTLIEVCSPLSLPPIGSKVLNEAKKFLSGSELAINMPGRNAHRQMLKNVVKEFDKWCTTMPSMMRHAANLELAACAQLAKNLGQEEVYVEIEKRLPDGVRFEVSPPVPPTGEATQDGGPVEGQEAAAPAVEDSAIEIVGQTVHDSDASGKPPLSGTV